MKVNLGPREASLLMDGLLALEGIWEGTKPGEAYGPKPGEEDRMRRLFQKLRPVMRGGTK